MFGVRQCLRKSANLAGKRFASTHSTERVTRTSKALYVALAGAGIVGASLYNDRSENFFSFGSKPAPPVLVDYRRVSTGL